MFHPGPFSRAHWIFERLARTCDVVLESFPPGHLAQHGLGYANLSQWNPHIVLTSISPYGQTGPYKDDMADDLEVMAASGFLSLLGSRKRPPVGVSEPQTYLWGGLNAAVSSLIAFVYRQLSGQGQWVDVSCQASMVTVEGQAPIFWDVLQQKTYREGNYLSGRNIHGARVCAIYPCRDGYVNFSLYAGVAGRLSNQGLAQWMRDRHAPQSFVQTIDWGQWNVVTALPEQIVQIEADIGQFFQTITKKEFFEAAITYRILGYPVSDAHDLLENEQLASMGFWQHIDLGSWGTVRLPGPYGEFSDSTWTSSRPAPQVGEHNAEIYAELGLEPEDLAILAQSRVI